LRREIDGDCCDYLARGCYVFIGYSVMVTVNGFDEKMPGHSSFSRSATH